MDAEVAEAETKTQHVLSQCSMIAERHQSPNYNLNATHANSRIGCKTTTSVVSLSNLQTWLDRLAAW
jgi:hypothetical protein